MSTEAEAIAIDGSAFSEASRRLGHAAEEAAERRDAATPRREQSNYKFGPRLSRAGSLIASTSRRPGVPTPVIRADKLGVADATAAG